MGLEKEKKEDDDESRLHQVEEVSEEEETKIEVSWKEKTNMRIKHGKTSIAP